MAIDTVPPLISAQINYLLSHCPFSVKLEDEMTLQVEQMWSGCKNPNFLDRFTLAIPYCLDHIKWDVTFNAMYPLAAPDVIFGPEDEGFQPYAGGARKSSKNSLANWNSRDPSQLHSLIVELRDAYMEYQRRRIGEVDDERVKFEISTMLSREGIEMFMSLGTDKPEEVKFAVPLLDMDLNRLVAGSTWRHPQKVYLQVIFPVGKKYSSVPSPPRLKLISSPELKALFSTEDLKLPTWMDGMCTAEYLPNLEQMLNSQIKDAVSSIEIRRKFIQSLAPHLGRPIEADPVFCRKATFLCSSGVFTFQVHFTLSLQFPKQQPALVLQSSQHFNSHGAPVKSPTLSEYPWSPRWNPSEKADRIFDFLADEALNFKKYCNQLNQQ
ncbi:BRISC and BRCA1-A complex member 2-like isoform X3 [Salvia hispanica]|uniref:BRISC and BRCA1-A complex member 2-like isoform X3 n=1 Tax=Salvia hispanica TaxID=49212 RepID=UPI00200952FA|nr:BRISC and BRCA1-A complex member 2-like isoform X3 [Salvia hispanica]